MKKETGIFDFSHNYEKEDVLLKIKEKNKNKPKYNFLDGPITANAPMCLHHIWGRTLKDLFNRYNAIAGKQVDFVWGFDAQGMWVEVEVEKLLGLDNKKAIMQYGLDKFTEKCIERVDHFKNIQIEQSKRMAQLGDWDNSYITNSDKNIETIWNFLKVCNDKKMIKQSYKPMPWCPRCGTSLSEHEMSGSYKEVTHKAVFIKAKIKDSEEKILVWTTTPWTLSANVAIAVNPELTYVKCKVKSDKDLIIVCKDAIKVLREDLVKVVSEIKGSELVGKEYSPFLKLKKQDFVHKIIAWDDVDAKEGSGAVHIAPGCGAEDFELGKKLNLPQIIPVGEDGRFDEEFEWLAGMSADECKDKIFEKLEENKTYYYNHNYKHKYPFCWRCKTDVIFRLVSGFDIVTDKIREKLIKAANSVNWSPEFMGKTMNQWLTDMGDWNISRRRFYGLPLPFYLCKCGHINVIGSKEELRNRAVDKSKVDALPHLHRPYIDDVEILCEKCNKTLSRVTEVGDCWLDAGIAPFSTKPEGQFKADMVLEMKEQVRLWFYSQLFMSVVLTGEAPYKSVVGYSTMLDEDGKKFSKTGPKKIEVEEVANKYGVDVLRWLFVSANPNFDMRFGESIVEESKKKLLAIWNAYVFYVTYAIIDKPDVKNHKPENLTVTDIWLVQKTNEYIKQTKKEYEDFKAHNVIKLTNEFIEDISNFYIRVNRRRYWKNGQGQDKLNAYWCLWSALRSIVQVISPIVPSYSEYLWSNCFGEGEDYVMLNDYPNEIKIKSKENMLEHVEFVKSVISLGLALRAENQIAIKQPLSKLFVKSNKEKSLEMFIDLIKDQLNIKEIEIVEEDDKFNTPYLIVNFKKAGAVLKDKVQGLKTALSNIQDMQTLVKYFEKGDKLTIGEFKDLSPELFEKKLLCKEGFVIRAEGDITVVLDTAITPELLDEGMVREFIRNTQIERANQKFDIQDRIKLTVQIQDKKMLNAVNNYKEKIMEEVLAVEMNIKEGKSGNEIFIKLA